MSANETETLSPFSQKIQTYSFRSAYRSFLSEEKIVRLHADMQARNLVEVSIVTAHCASVLQRAGRDPHVVGRNGTATASEFPIHSRILCCRRRVDHQLVHPLRRQKLLELLAILCFAGANGKAAQQFAEHNT